MQQNNQAKGLRSTIGVLRKGQTVPAVKLVQTNPTLAATISKLIHDNKRPNIYNAGEENPAISQSNLMTMSNAIRDRGKDVQNVLELFPDMELAIQILVSSIISPKDLTSVEINFTAPDGLLCASILPILLNKISEHFERTHKIEPLLPDIIRGALAEKGSYPMLVLPESTLDQLINSKSALGTEAFSEHLTTNKTTGLTGLKSVGVLGDPEAEHKARYGLESLSLSAYKGEINTDVFGRVSKQPKLTGLLTVTDNVLAFKTASLLTAARRAKIDDCYAPITTRRHYAGEALGTPYGFKKAEDGTPSHLSRDAMRDLVYKRQGSQSKAFLKLTTPDSLTRDTVGNPLVMKLPAESVIPITVPGDSRHHVAYLVLVDEEGYPINSISNKSSMDDLQSRLNNAQSTSMGSFLMNKVSQSMQGGCKELGLDQATKVYSEIVEKDLLDRLRNGLHGSNVQIAPSDDVYRIMLARALSNMNTQLVYVPVSLMTYFAFKYYDSGVGKSLLDDSAVLSSLRAMSMLSRTMAQVRNAIGKIDVNVKLDPRDPDPIKAIEKVQDTIARANAGSFPVGLQTAADIVDWMAKAGWRIKPTNHPGLPDMEIGYENVEMRFPVPDTELDEDMRKRHIQSTGLNPETVDASNGSDFATTIVTNNALLNKRVKQYQEILLPLLSQHCRQYAKYSGGLTSNLRKVLKDNWQDLETGVMAALDGDAVLQISEDKQVNVRELMNQDQEYVIDLVIEELINSFEVTLPSPDSNNLRVKIDQLKEYEELLDATLEYRISAKFLTDTTAGELSGQMDNVKEMVKAYYMRAYMDEQSIAPELQDLTVIDKSSNPTARLLTDIAEHNNDMLRAVLTLLGKTVPIAKAADKDLTNITGGDELDSSSTDYSSDSGDTGGDDTGGMGDDFGMDGLDMSFDEPSAETTETTETTEETTTTETSSSDDADTGGDVLGVTGL